MAPTSKEQHERNQPTSSHAAGATVAGTNAPYATTRQRRRRCGGARGHAERRACIRTQWSRRINCASTHYVVTRSKSAGDTKHVKTIFGVDHKFTFSNVSPSNPWRSWDGPEWYTGVHGWGVAAQILESHQVECWQKPI